MTIAQMVDLKHGITTDNKLVKVLADGTEEELPEGEPRILFRGRDKLALPMLRFYHRLCVQDGATPYQLEAVQGMIDRFEQFGATNITKQPGITMNLPWDGTPS